MNETPKSIWRKPWQGWRGGLLWFALLAAAAFVVIFCIALVSGEAKGAELLVVPLVGAVSLALLIVLMILFCRWLCSWRNFRRFLFGVACLITLIAVFYAEENVRGKHAWRKFKTEWEAKGERFDLVSVAPPRVSDDENFAMAPIWVEEISAQIGMEKAKTWYGDKVAALGHTNFVRRLEIPVELWGQGFDFTNHVGSWQTAEKNDLKLWQDYYRQLASVTNAFPVASQPQSPAVDVLLALSKYDSTIEELRRASKLPHSRFPLGYGDPDPATILLPHLSSLKGCTTTLRLRAVAELQSGQTEKALDDIKLMFRLTDSIRTEPTLISHLVRIAMQHIVVQPIWEGLADHKWTDAQLAALDSELAKLDFLADYESSMRGERAFSLGIIDYWRGARGDLADIAISDDSAKVPGVDFAALLVRFYPSGWFEQNKLSIARMHRDYLLPPINLDTRTVSIAAVVRSSDACDQIPLTPYNLFGRLLLPALNNVSPKSARAQSAIDMARIACALERYRLAHGNFPATLDMLTPQFIEKIPRDIINGQPLKYRRTDDPPSQGSGTASGQFILYSVGWNETDDGGKVVLTEKGNADIRKGDWVWRYPAKEGLLSAAPTKSD